MSSQVVAEGFADREAGQGGLTQAERVVDTFVAPTKTFRDVLRSTTWWLPFLLVCVVSLGVTFAIDRQVGFEKVAENGLHSSPRQEEQLAKLDPDKRAAQLRKMGVGYKYSSYASPVFVLVFSAVGALGLWLSFNFGLGAQTTFAQMFCVWMYASLPRLLGGLLTAVMLYAGNDADSFDLKNPVGTNVGYYLTDAPAWLRTALSFVDVIGLWVLVLLVIGTAIVAKVSRGKAAAVVVGWWLVILVVSVGLTAAFS